ncbi:hypothetical protein Bbelb_114970 [Branchiostoma belcheri]|nr:hypothetical protein Bbelb_114970 [Branchiostoma belcheri]
MKKLNPFKKWQEKEEKEKKHQKKQYGFTTTSWCGHKIGGMSGFEPGTLSSEARTLPLRHTTPQYSRIFRYEENMYLMDAPLVEDCNAEGNHTGAKADRVGSRPRDETRGERSARAADDWGSAVRKGDMPADAPFSNSPSLSHGENSGHVWGLIFHIRWNSAQWVRQLAPEAAPRAPAAAFHQEKSAERSPKTSGVIPHHTPCGGVFDTSRTDDQVFWFKKISRSSLRWSLGSTEILWNSPEARSFPIGGRNALDGHQYGKGTEANDILGRHLYDMLDRHLYDMLDRHLYDMLDRHLYDMLDRHLYDMLDRHLYEMLDRHLHDMLDQHLYDMLNRHLHDILDRHLHDILDRHLYDILDSDLYDMLDRHLYDILDRHLYEMLDRQLYNILDRHLYEMLDRHLYVFTTCWAGIFTSKRHAGPASLQHTGPLLHLYGTINDFY